MLQTVFFYMTLSCSQDFQMLMLRQVVATNIIIYVKDASLNTSGAGGRFKVLQFSQVVVQVTCRFSISYAI